MRPKPQTKRQVRAPTVNARSELPKEKKSSRKARKRAQEAWPDDPLFALSERRVAIEGVAPEIDAGRFAAKTIVGQQFTVEADIFCDGHDKLSAALCFKKAESRTWAETPMVLFDNDRWRANLTFEENSFYEYTIVAWRNLFASWHDEVAKKHAAGLDITLELEEGCRLIATTVAQKGLPRGDAKELRDLAKSLEGADAGTRFSHLINAEVSALMARCGVRTNVTQYDRVLSVFVDRPLAGSSAWYELMPRSMSDDTVRHGTFDDVIAKLDYVKDMGFDVLYFPPIHPVGTSHRKGRNNSLVAEPGDPGSPYAIGSREGGHDAIHPELGTLEDFRRLVSAAKKTGLEIALDFAIQCSPDHPWIKQHPEWFDWRPDGTIKYAENPPKKYEDIVNVHFYRDAFPDIWYALRDVVRFWVDQGVRIFRVDNPHTKPYPFWEWLIGSIRQTHPETIFLAEAFTRPKVMKRLAKLGFNQSYSYFTWRNAKHEITEYLTELTTSECVHYMRPNFFTNTPDINPFYLQSSGRPGFQTRLVLAASLGANYGIYCGFELCEAASIPGKEEYLNSEKYEIRAWDWDREGHIRDDIRLMNELRRTHPALREFANVSFYNCWNDNLLYYGKRTADRSSFLLFVVNLDPHNPQGGHFEVPLWEFGLSDDASIEVEDLVTGSHFTWHGKVQHMWIDPHARPYHVWRLIPPGAPR